MPGSSVGRAGVSLPEYAVFKAEAPTLSSLAAWRRQTVTLRERNESDRVLAQLVIGDLQGLWGLRALRGRVLTLADEQRGAPRVAVLSHRFWSTRLGSAEDAVGRDVVIDGTLHTVVGVLTPDIELGNLSEIDLWVPFSGNPALASRAERGWRPVGRLQDGTSHEDANAQVTAIADRLEREHPDINRDWIARVGTTREALGGANTWIVLSLLAVVVGLLLLLACANVMNLLIARLIGRRQELAVRTALGATRGQVVRQIVSESVMLGLAGGALGLAVAWAGLAASTRWPPSRSSGSWPSTSGCCSSPSGSPSWRRSPSPFFPRFACSVTTCGRRSARDRLAAWAARRRRADAPAWSSSRCRSPSPC